MKAESSRISTFLASIQDDGAIAERRVHSLLESDLGAVLPLHISLSRSIALSTDQRRPFLDTLERGIGDARLSPYVILSEDFGHCGPTTTGLN